MSETSADLTTLTDEMTARIAALGTQVNDLAARAPGAEGPVPPELAALEHAVQAQAQVARARLEARVAVASRLAEAGAQLAALEDIVARQTDTARVQVTASIADLYDVAPGGACRDVSTGSPTRASSPTTVSTSCRARWRVSGSAWTGSTKPPTRPRSPICALRSVARSQ